jgi:hypothetical protein
MMKLGSFRQWLVFTEEVWVLGKAKTRQGRISPGEFIALSKRPDGNWQFRSLSSDAFGVMAGSTVQSYVQSIKDSENRIITAASVEELKAKQAGGTAPKPTPAPVQAKPQPEREKTWVLARAVLNQGKLAQGDLVALSRMPDNSWEYQSLASNVIGVLPAANIQNYVQSLKDDKNQPIIGKTVEELKAKLPPEEKPPEELPKGPKAHPHILPPEKMSEEQNKIDTKFEQVMQNPDQSHIMINALAGTGKTTMLKHLAWKYGSQDQKWLYLVFNTKNKVEAKEKFPPWVQVATTNGFLGEVLGLPKNKTRIKPTERVVELSKFNKDEGGGGKLEKARLLADGPQFGSLMDQVGVPDKNAANRLPMGEEAKTVISVLGSIRYYFKEETLTLVGLAKSFAVDPRQPDMEGKLKGIMEKYDFDTSFSDVKERIQKMSYSYQVTVQDRLKKILGYDFMDKDYTEEIVQGTVMLLNDTMPHATNQMYNKGGLDYSLGHFRDFNDDLWFAAIHADEIHWPHYDYVLADEVQDFNEDQKIVLRKLHEAGAKIVAVGDPNQSIYRFRGADSQAFDNLSKQLGDLSADKNVTYSLSANYRSRPAILDFVNQRTHVNNLVQGKQFKDGLPGTVTNQDIDYKSSFDMIQQERAKDKEAIKKGQKPQGKETAFIARTNEPLVEAALRLLAGGVPFIIVGRDVASDLEKHIHKIMIMTKLTDSTPVGKLRDKLNQHLSKEEDSHGGQSSKKAYLQELDATTNALVASIGSFDPTAGGDDYDDEGDDGDYRPRGYGYGHQSEPKGKGKPIGEFRQWLKQKLGGLDVTENERDLREYKKKLKEENPVILTTSHKSKGLEFDRVFILRDDQFPHPKASRPEDLAQEANAKYVAYTRAMDELHIVKLKGQPGVPEN